MIKQEINVETGEVVLVDLSPNEEAEFLASIAANEQEISNQELVAEAEAEAAEAEAAAKESARAKLAALGLTEAEVAALVK
jgi:hypothetical protein